MFLKAQDIQKLDVPIPLGFINFFAGDLLESRCLAPNQCSPCRAQLITRHFLHQPGIPLGNPLGELTLIGVTSFRLGVFIIPHRVFLITEQLEILLHNRFLMSPF